MQTLSKYMDCCVSRSKVGARDKAGSVAKWLLPSALLILIPKCPLCIVAYTAVATGIGISVSTAAGIRYTFIVTCIGLFVFAVFRSLGRPLQSIPRANDVTAAE